MECARRNDMQESRSACLLFKATKARETANYWPPKFLHHALLGRAYLDRRCPDFVCLMQVLFYCISLVVIKSVLIKPVLIKSFEMKRPFMVWIGFIPISCSKVAKEGQRCFRLLVLQRVAQNAKSCSKVAEHNLFMPSQDLPSTQNLSVWK